MNNLDTYSLTFTVWAKAGMEVSTTVSYHEVGFESTERLRSGGKCHELPAQGGSWSSRRGGTLARKLSGTPCEVKNPGVSVSLFS